MDPDGIFTIYIFNEKGEQTYTVWDTNRDYVIDFAGPDARQRAIDAQWIEPGIASCSWSRPVSD